MGDAERKTAAQRFGWVAGVALLALVVVKAWWSHQELNALRSDLSRDQARPAEVLEKKSPSGENAVAAGSQAACRCDEKLYCVGEMGGVYCLRTDGKKKYVKAGGGLDAK